MVNKECFLNAFGLGPVSRHCSLEGALDQRGYPGKTQPAGEEFGEARLVTVLERYSRGSAAIILEQIINTVKEFAHGAEQYDDVTALVVKYTGPK